MTDFQRGDRREVPLRIAERDKDALDRLARERSSTVQRWDRSKLIREAIEIYLRDHGEKVDGEG